MTITKVLEFWDCQDKRFPSDKELQSTPPTESMLLSLQEIQLQPVGVIKKGKDFYFVWGRRRLAAIRQLQAEEKHGGVVEVLVMQGIDPSEVGRLALLENSVRSSNEVNTYSILYEMIKAQLKSGGDLGQIYKDTAKETGMTIGEIKAIEKKWHKVPTWSVNAVLRGEIAPSTAKAIGKLSDTLQKECKEELKTNGALSTATVEAKRRFVQTQVYSSMQASLGMNIPATRDFFSRKEVEEILRLLPNEHPEDTYGNEARNYIHQLLNS
jgi:ParB-like chromosome segregation protein Spo0J